MVQQLLSIVIISAGITTTFASAGECDRPEPGSASNAAVIKVDDRSPSSSSASEQSANIVEIAASAGSFGTLLQAATAAGLAGTLAEGGPFTVFAPTDEAFEKVPADTLAALLREENRDALRTVLLYHVVNGRVNASDAISAGSADTLIQQGVSFSIRDGRLFVNDSGVIANDIQASNGVIHVIDTVLIPDDLQLAPQGRLVIGFVPQNPGNVLASQLGVDRDEAIVVGSVTRNSEAARAGLQRFDVIVEINGAPATRQALADSKKEAGAGGTVRLTVIRGGERRHIDTKVGVESH